MMVKKSWKEKGYVDEAIDKSMDLKSEIRKMAKEKNAVVLAHFYCPDAVQDVADFIGESLALAQWAAKTDAKTIVMCGVHFMAETDKILCPDKLVLTPDLNAGCSLADSWHSPPYARALLWAVRLSVCASGQQSLSSKAHFPLE